MSRSAAGKPASHLTAMLSGTPPVPLRSRQVPSREAQHLLEALSVLATVLKSAKVSVLAELETFPADILLTAEQRAAVDANLVPLSYLRTASGTKVGEEEKATARNVAVCDTCGRWLVWSGALPSGCTLTSGCAGSILKPAPAARVAVADRYITLRDRVAVGGVA